MSALNEFWKDAFGADISSFEEILMRRGARVMFPEEPLYVVYAMLVRAIYEGQGETEKALLKFGPELADRAQAIISAANGIERELALLAYRTNELGMVMDRVAQRVGIMPHPHELRNGLHAWLSEYRGLVWTVALTFPFCVGFVLASYVSG